jgi:hypothetical protein
LSDVNSARRRGAETGELPLVLTERAEPLFAAIDDGAAARPQPAVSLRHSGELHHRISAENS